MTHLGRIARLAAQATARSALGKECSSSGLCSTSGGSSGSRGLPPCLHTSRRMGGGGGPIPNEAVTYEGVTIYKPLRWQVWTGEIMCGLMWFWILYRAYHDGETFLYGHAYEFEKELKAEAEGKAAHHH